MDSFRASCRPGSSCDPEEGKLSLESDVYGLYELQEKYCRSNLKSGRCINILQHTGGLFLCHKYTLASNIDARIQYNPRFALRGIGLPKVDQTPSSFNRSVVLRMPHELDRPSLEVPHFCLPQLFCYHPLYTHHLPF